MVESIFNGFFLNHLKNEMNKKKLFQSDMFPKYFFAVLLAVSKFHVYDCYLYPVGVFARYSTMMHN